MHSKRLVLNSYFTQWKINYSPPSRRQCPPMCNYLRAILPDHVRQPTCDYHTKSLNNNDLQYNIWKKSYIVHRPYMIYYLLDFALQMQHPVEERYTLGLWKENILFPSHFSFSLCLKNPLRTTHAHWRTRKKYTPLIRPEKEKNILISQKFYIKKRFFLSIIARIYF